MTATRYRCNNCGHIHESVAFIDCGTHYVCEHCAAEQAKHATPPLFVPVPNIARRGD